MKIWMLLAALSISVFASAPIHAATKNKNGISDVTVFVTAVTDESGFTNNNSRPLMDSAKDLKNAMAKQVTLIDDPAKADVVLTIVGRSDVPNGGATTFWSYGNATTYPAMSDSVQVKMQVGDYVTGFLGSSPRGILVSYWHQAAGNAAKGIEQWIAANHDKLIAMRAKGSDQSPATAQNDAGGQK